jgi:hypothetical protein
MNFSTRRAFLKNTLKAGILGLFFDPFRSIFAFNKQEPGWIELVDCARWCPTVHNLQPHKIKIISETEAELYYDPSRLLPVGDPGSVFVTVAMGIFHEHLSIAASSFGKKVEMTRIFEPIKTGGTVPKLFAKLKIVKAEEPDELDRSLILKRRTSRLHYDGNPLRQVSLDKLKTEAGRFDHEFFSSSEQELVDYVINLNQETLFEDISSKENSEELNYLFRYTEKEAEEHKDGLWAKCMCFPGSLMRSVFQHPGKWHKGFRKKFLAKHYKDSFKGTATICWFGGSFEDTNDWLNAGRMLARNWLLLTQEGAYIHPFGSLITNVNAYGKINQKFTQPEKGKKIWLIFRAGYSKTPARSFRLTTQEIIIK